LIQQASEEVDIANRLSALTCSTGKAGKRCWNHPERYPA